eukprot:scaffold137_cov398-Prasinococcus_capsulatus_cf.AAC.36
MLPQVRVVVSYEGSPITFHGVKLIIPPVLYRDYMGPWRGLFMQLKKDVKWSVLRAVARLMGKKISELLPDSRDKQHAIPPESSSAMQGSYTLALAVRKRIPGPRLDRHPETVGASFKGPGAQNPLSSEDGPFYHGENRDKVGS